jgi:hypothetical protein
MHVSVRCAIMPKRTPSTHTAVSVGMVVSRLEKVLAELQVSKTLMEMEPPLKTVEVEWQTSLEVGLRSLRTWTDALRDAVDDKRMEMASNGGVSDSPASTAKPRKKKL